MERDQLEAVYGGVSEESGNSWDSLTSADVEAEGVQYHQLLIDMLRESSRIASAEAEQ